MQYLLDVKHLTGIGREIYKIYKIKVFFFEIAILPSVAFGILIANGGVHGMIKLNVKAPRKS
jgi:hypothetical protein